MIQESPRSEQTQPEQTQERAFQFGIRSIILATAAMSVFLACSRTFAEIMGVSAGTFIFGMGLSFLPAGFAFVVTGAIALAIKPEAKWANVSVKIGGIMMAALLPAAFIGSLMSGLLAYWLR